MIRQCEGCGRLVNCCGNWCSMCRTRLRNGKPLDAPIQTKRKHRETGPYRPPAKLAPLGGTRFIVQAVSVGWKIVDRRGAWKAQGCFLDHEEAKAEAARMERVFTAPRSLAVEADPGWPE